MHGAMRRNCCSLATGPTQHLPLQPEMRGVRRDLNSLTWDAFLESPATQQAPADMAQAGSFMAGFKQVGDCAASYRTRDCPANQPLHSV